MPGATVPATQVPAVGLKAPDVVVWVGVVDADAKVDWMAEPGDVVLVGIMEDAAAVVDVLDGVAGLPATPV